MLIEAVRENARGTGRVVWKFLFQTGQTEHYRFVFELVEFSKWKASKPKGSWRLVGMWGQGICSTLPWTDVWLPEDVWAEVTGKMKAKLDFSSIRAANNPVPIRYKTERAGVDVLDELEKSLNERET